MFIVVILLLNRLFGLLLSLIENTKNIRENSGLTALVLAVQQRNVDAIESLERQISEN